MRATRFQLSGSATACPVRSERWADTGQRGKDWQWLKSPYAARGFSGSPSRGPASNAAPPFKSSIHMVAAAGSSGGIVGALAPHVPENWNPKKAFQLDSLLMAKQFWAEVQQSGGRDPGYARRWTPATRSQMKQRCASRGSVPSTARQLWGKCSAVASHPKHRGSVGTGQPVRVA